MVLSNNSSVPRRSRSRSNARPNDFIAKRLQDPLPTLNIFNKEKNVRLQASIIEQGGRDWLEIKTWRLRCIYPMLNRLVGWLNWCIYDNI
jgi:hypothetical protein